MRVIRLLIGSSKRLFLVASLASVLTGIFSTLVIKTIHEAIRGDSFDQSIFIQKFVLFWILYGALSIIASYCVALLTKKIIHKLRVRLSVSILKAKFETMERNHQKLLPILTEDIKTIAYTIDRLPGVTTGLATVIGILIYMVWYSPALSLSLVAVFSSVFLFTRFALPYVRKYADQARNYLNDLFELFHGLVFGMKELAINRKSKDKFIREFIMPTSDRQNHSFLKENVVAAIINRSTDMILLLGIATLIVVVFQTGLVTLDFLGEYITLVLFTLAPLSTAAGFFSNLKRIEVAVEKIENIGIELDKNSLPESGTEPLQKNTNNPLIQLKELEHSYYHSDKDEHFAMGPIDLSIKEGETLFVVGGNGSGKTTLAKLILGLYKPLAGEINYYGQKITSKNIFTYRSHFAAVFTDSYLFPKFLDVDKEYLHDHGERFLKMFHLEKKVKIKDHGFSTKNLSEGQKKRLSLINAILENKEIYLFDEWAANQDPLFKEVFYKEIVPYLKVLGKTQIIISHDDHYFHMGDRVIKLRAGKITEQNHGR